MNRPSLPTSALLAWALSTASFAGDPRVAGERMPPAVELERGRYLVQISGCHDCHTPGYAQSGGQAPPDLWLTGDDTAHAGPWGASFASNLRLTLLRFNDEQWLDHARGLSTRPPMPWFTLRAMTDADLLAILRYVQWLGPKGEPAPPALAPGEPWNGPTVRYMASPD